MSEDVETEIVEQEQEENKKIKFWIELDLKEYKVSQKFKITSYWSKISKSKDLNDGEVSSFGEYCLY